jgi:hypothetical protein
MPSASYYRGQARLLLLWASETSDRFVAARLEARARKLLALADQPDATIVRDLNPLLDEFNNRQMSTRRPAQQQQQIQPEREKKD